MHGGDNELEAKDDSTQPDGNPIRSGIAVGHPHVLRKVTNFI